MKKFGRYTIKVLKIVFLFVLLIYLVTYIYISVNQKKIIAQVTQEISEKIDGKVTIKTADISFFKSFPRIAVHAENISITDSLYPVHKHIFLEAKDLFVNLNVFKLIRKLPALSGIRMVSGSVFMYTDSSGYSNTYLLKGKKDPAGGPKKTTGNISLNNILLQDVRFTLQDNKREKFHDFKIKELKVAIDDVAENIVLKVKANMRVNSLAFNTARGTFLKGADFNGTFKLLYGKQSQVLSFDKIKISLAQQPFTLSGTFDLGDKNPAFTLKVLTENASFQNVKKLLPKRIDSSLSIVSVDKPVNAIATLYGPLRGGEPFIQVEWKVKNAALLTPFMDFEHASFTGNYKNEVVAGLPRKDPNSIIIINDFTAEWKGLKINSGKIEILDLLTPRLSCDLQSAFPLTDLNELLQSGSLEMTAGTANVLLTYKGPIERNNNTNSFLNGNIKFNNGKILYVPRNVTMTEVNGLLSFKNSNVNIENIHCKVLGNDVTMNGVANNVLSLISSEPNKVNIDYNIYSPTLNLAPFKFLLQSRNRTVAKGKSKFIKAASQIDDLLEKSRINVDLKTDRLLYEKLAATDVRANITVLQDRYLLNNVSMNLADGSMGINGQLVNLQNGRHQAALHTGIQNVNVEKLFYAFNNFGQDGITDKNLEGKLTANADVQIDISTEGKVLPSSSKGIIDFSLKNGALNNFEPLKKIQNFVFKKRDFENISFAELKNKLSINSGEITINRMEIQSSVFSFFVEGLFNPRGGNTDISVQVPLSNLKKRKEDYVPTNMGVDKKAGSSVFLRGQPGKDGNIAFKLDLFQRYKKEKEK